MPNTNTVNMRISLTWSFEDKELELPKVKPPRRILPPSVSGRWRSYDSAVYELDQAQRVIKGVFTRWRANWEENKAKATQNPGWLFFQGGDDKWMKEHVSFLKSEGKSFVKAAKSMAKAHKKAMEQLAYLSRMPEADQQRVQQAVEKYREDWRANNTEMSELALVEHFQAVHRTSYGASSTIIKVNDEIVKQLGV